MISEFYTPLVPKGHDFLQIIGSLAQARQDLSLIHIFAVLSGSNQFSVSDKVIRGGVKIQKRDLETGDTKPQGSATLKDTAFDIISLNDNAVLVEGKLYKKNEVVKTIHADIEGVASTSADLLPYGKFRIVESEAPDGYLEPTVEEKTAENTAT